MDDPLSIVRVVLSVYGRDVTVMAGSKIMALPSGSILVLPPAGTHQIPVEITPEGDSRGHPALVTVEPQDPDGPIRNGWAGTPVKTF
jgi:hypothetical protein